MNKPLNFKGIAFYELIDFFELHQKSIPIKTEVKQVDGTYQTVEIYKKNEVEKLSIIVNGNKVEFEVEEKAEVELIKLKKFLLENESNKEVVNAARVFLKELIKHSLKYDFNAPGFIGILQIEDDSTFIEWFVANIENMWA